MCWAVFSSESAAQDAGIRIGAGDVAHKRAGTVECGWTFGCGGIGI